MDRRDWQTAVHRVGENQTQLSEHIHAHKYKYADRDKSHDNKGKTEIEKKKKKKKKVKGVLEGTNTNKASGGDRIPAELFQVLKDENVKVLHSICQQIWKTQQQT